ncbi:MAG TPA: putative sulfate/molybdate transporter [Actinomycetota bacterium]|nr:putative sulfate/molybdate transporter [Actinomycetota bacterium]
MGNPGRLAPIVGDASGAVADLGVLVPIATALILKNGLDAGTVLVGVGALYLAAGLYFRVPVPVQPIKAAAAIAIARDLSPATISAAGVVLGLTLIVLSTTGAARWLSRIFTTPIVRGLQFGVGLLLVSSALGLPARPVPPATWAAAAACAGILVLAARRRNWPLALVLVAGGVAWSLVTGAHAIVLRPDAWQPGISGNVFSSSVLWSAFTVLVIPQIPLTFGNAVIAVVDVEHRYFGTSARRVTPAGIGLSCGIANVVAGSLGGMPMCHGSGGLTAHYRGGARSYRMNLFIGVPLLILGLGFGATAFSVLALIPVAVLVGLLAFTGVMHALLVVDLRGFELGVAVAMGVIGVWTSNLAIALAVGLTLVWLPAIARRMRRHVESSRRAVQ